MALRKMLPAGAAAALLLLTAGFVRMSPEQTPDFRLLALGQALVEYDLRDHSSPAVELAREYLTGADVCFTNLEVSIAGPGAGAPTREGTYFHAAPPAVLDFLQSIGVNMLSLSNNHSWDLGTKGILGTISEVEKRGFVHAGTGQNESAASSPAFLHTAAGKVALIAMVSARMKEDAVANRRSPE